MDTVSSSLVALIQGHESAGKTGEGGTLGGNAGGGSHGDGGGDGGKSVQQPLHAVQASELVICFASAHDSDSSAEHSSLLAPEPHVAVQLVGGGGGDGGAGGDGGGGGEWTIRTYSR